MPIETLCSSSGTPRGWGQARRERGRAIGTGRGRKRQQHRFRAAPYPRPCAMIYGSIAFGLSDHHHPTSLYYPPSLSPHSYFLSAYGLSLRKLIHHVCRFLSRFFFRSLFFICLRRRCASSPPPHSAIYPVVPFDFFRTV